MPTIAAKTVCDEVRDMLGKELCDILDTDGWSDVVINPNGLIFIDRGEFEKLDIYVEPNNLTTCAQLLANYSSREFNQLNSQTLVTVIPIMNLRVTFIGPPAVDRVCCAFRKPSTHIYTPKELIEEGMMTDKQLDYISNAILNKRNIVLSGGTGSGKTTVMNSLLTLIPKSERLYVMEELPEIQLIQENIVALQPNKGCSYREELSVALAMVPSRIMIGECRHGDQTMELLKLWNTGHPGGLTTLHANNSKEVVKRIDQLCSEVSVNSQRAMIEEAVDVIIQMGRVPNSKQRKVIEMYDVKEQKYVN